MTHLSPDTIDVIYCTLLFYVVLSICTCFPVCTGSCLVVSKNFRNEEICTCMSECISYFYFFHLRKSFIRCFLNLVYNFIQVIIYEGLKSWFPYNFPFSCSMVLLSLYLLLFSSFPCARLSFLCYFLALILLLHFIFLQSLVVASLVSQSLSIGFSNMHPLGTHIFFQILQLTKG
jgi:hypothetical protein